jgi:bifunctional non-homologous end joining protein LigD
LIELDGRDLRSEPIETRKAALAGLVKIERALSGESRRKHADCDPGLQLYEYVDLPGDIVFAHACKLGCEGIVSKRLGPRYRPGPTKCPDWIKVKNPAAPAIRREAEEE